MIARIWRGKVKEDKVESFLKTVHEHDIPILNSQLGCLQALVGKEKSGESNFVILSIWKNLESLKKFTGPNWKDSVPGPTEEKLVEGVPTVEHYLLTPFNETESST